ncbi:sigma-70 family RNA polymerase sigma factor [Clostridium sp. FAM 1755]|uniref:Sigma-70 family RNA polymerase sigma factor n=1 Tax=Clostridium sporogenes TaxID=1509 RepID=A0AAE4FJS5_CLOSG|nr:MULTISPECIES: sigma-70 family RNA polymerase sigma factor [Clostridium]KOR26729.1 RNA polymerase sigma factor [Clostridium sp. L74]MDS1002416.1 sigma-70 family RNA polymerase sigma factor [Clostridium sporogenes]
MYKLFEKYKNGDSEALGKIIAYFVPIILKEASKWKISCYEYEDLVQHGYLSVIRAVNMFKGEESKFIPYCIKTIKTNYKALLKGEIKHHREIPFENILDKSNEYLFTIEDEIIAYENIKELYKALDKLTPEEREVIDSFYIKNNTLKEIANSKNKSYNSVRYIKNKAIKKLQNMLEWHS